MGDNTNVWLNRFRDIEYISAHGYVVQTGNINILFLGSCRMVMLCVYIIEYLKFDIFKKYGISIITDYHYKLLHRFESPMQPIIKDIVENADIIIHEPTKTCEYLNTAFNTTINIYNSFNLKPTYRNIRIPHIGCILRIEEFRDFVLPGLARLDINPDKPTDNSPLTIKEIQILRQLNIDKLLKFVEAYEFPALATLIKNDWNRQRLFATFSHPMPICFIYLFKDLIPKLFGVSLDGNIENHLKPINSMILLGLGQYTEEDYESGISRGITNTF
jgi:hypothetical protein